MASASQIKIPALTLSRDIVMRRVAILTSSIIACTLSVFSLGFLRSPTSTVRNKHDLRARYDGTQIQRVWPLNSSRDSKEWLERYLAALVRSRRGCLGRTRYAPRGWKKKGGELAGLFSRKDATRVEDNAHVRRCLGCSALFDMLW